MKQSLTLLYYIFLITSCAAPIDQEHFLDPGISIQLTDFRKGQISDIHYQLDFSIPSSKTEPIPANLLLEAKISNTKAPLILDFNEKSENLLSLLVNGKPVEIQHENEHLIIPEEHLQKGKNSIEISFVAGDLSLNRNDDFLYTLLVPDRASTLFPCFDQPDLKANYTLSITAPNDWKVLAGGPLINKKEVNGNTTHHFGKSDLMSTYLFSFVAGKFETASSSGDFPQTLLYRETNPEKIEASIPELFKLHQQSVDYLETYTGYKFPFQKLDFATIPIFQYGGMEHVGAIQYRESSLFQDQNATDSELLSRAKLIGHETAHMWFGDLVTMQWFNDVWMKEVFANFMAGKIVNPNYPTINHELLFLTAHYPAAYSEDRTAGSNPIRQYLSNLKNAGSLYGRIIYDKAPIMMRQLETVMGEKPFQKGIQEYIKTFANGNANWNDLVEILDKETPVDLQQWSNVWVNQSGRPILSEKLELTPEGKISSLTISQTAEDGSEKIWPQLFDITLIYPEEIKTFSLNMQGKTLEVEDLQGLDKPIAILYNSNGLGYGVFPISTDFIFQIPNLDDEVMRAHSYINLFENTLSGNISPLETTGVIRKGISAESNEIIIRLLSSELNSLFWKYLSEENRNLILPELEEEVWQLLNQDLPANVKKSLFSLYSDIAYNESGQERLYRIWSKKLEIPNLKLNPDNFTNIAMTLALYKHPNSEEILSEERTRITNPDKLNRFDFLRPALSKKPEERDTLFLSFQDPVNREKESWVLAACGFIHHPLNHKTSVKHVRLALELMEEIQRTGDIFFPKGWISNTAGLHTSPEAAETVKEFLEANPDYNPVLKSKILQATDDLIRVQKLASK
ncbi:M1 family aminopeptidase [Algoriphagus sp. CAU 1675]|uniref:M1 family metallopeptidase n=1 Tax=Algoriphagus sp. CAU 1675 TaxID=3032597 RepID=UPI0023DAC8C5|nr:M1 family aminopeptidase [Algoriphagus sp. CAU 1675]MDF2156972.1 M1 family aminopeptidase [Algoriphagus sp. CAU 1675]